MLCCSKRILEESHVDEVREAVEAVTITATLFHKTNQINKIK